MNDQKSLETAMWVMVILQTLGSLDMPGQGPRKMPAPRVYLPIIVSFFVLNTLADAGATRAAKALGWITVVTAMVLGPFGLRLATFFDNVATNFSPVPVTGKTVEVPQ